MTARSFASFAAVLVLAVSCGDSRTADRSASPHAPLLGVRGIWSSPRSLAFGRMKHTATLLPSGKIWVAGGADTGSNSVATSELFDPSTATFTTGPTLLTARAAHTATLLRDGMVFLVGGDGASGKVLATTELYDPSTGAVTAGPSLTTAREQPATVMLADGRVLITGGTAKTAEAEIFDPVTRTMSMTAGVMTAVRLEHTATRLPSGTVLLLGGVSEMGGSPTAAAPVAEVLDPVSGRFGPGPGNPTARVEHTATLLSDGTVLVAGGSDPLTGAALTSAEIYDPVSGAVVAVPQTPRAAHSALLLPSGRVLLAGGRPASSSTPSTASIDLFDPIAATITTQPETMAETREAFTATLLPGGDVAFIGGKFTEASPPLIYGVRQTLEVYAAETPDKSLSAATLSVKASTPQIAALGDGTVVVSGGTSPPSTALDVYDPKTDAIVSHAEMLVGRTQHTATTLGDGKILVVGGTSDDGVALDSAELFDGKVVSATGKMLNARTEHAAVRLSTGKVLVLGGSGAAGRTAELYDPATRTFAATGALVGARKGASATLLSDGAVLVAGGVDTTAPDVHSQATAEIYDPRSGQFTATASMTVAREHHTATLLASGKVLVMGGAASTTGDVFDPIKHTFEPTSHPMNASRQGMTATLLPSGNVAIIGGVLAGGSSVRDELYRPATEIFSFADSVANSSGHAAILISTGDVLLAGGVSQTQTRGKVELTLWKAGRPGEVSRRPIILQPTAAAAGGTVLVAGTGLNAAFAPGANAAPLSLWMPTAGGLLEGSLHPFTDTSATWHIPATALTGPGLLFAATNGIVSDGVRVDVAPASSGATCANDLDCASTHCADGVCCDTACTGACMACSAEKLGGALAGTCRAVPLHADPDAECPVEPSSTCGRSGGCDGAGACARYAEGTTCGSGGTCSNGTCAKVPICVDDTTVQDALGATRSCGAFRCRDGECIARCTSTSDCAAGLQCGTDGNCASPAVDGASSACACKLAGPRRRTRDEGVALALAALAFGAVVLRRRRGA